MVRRNYTTFHWIIGWGIVAIMAASTNTDAGDIAAIIAAAFIVAGTLFSIIKWFCRKCKLSHPFQLYYVLDKNIQKQSYQVNSSVDEQHVNIALLINAELTIEFIQVQFKGYGEKPTIIDLYDWNLPIGEKPKIVYAHSVQDGSWYWEYHPPFRRMAKSKVKIGINYIATKHFNGKLYLKITSEVSKIVGVPFIVKYVNQQ